MIQFGYIAAEATSNTTRTDLKFYIQDSWSKLFIIRSNVPSNVKVKELGIPLLNAQTPAMQPHYIRSPGSTHPVRDYLRVSLLSSFPSSFSPFLHPGLVLLVHLPQPALHHRHYRPLLGLA